MDVKQLRIRHNLTQQELADRTGIPRARIAKWEQGKGSPKLEDAKKLNEIFSEEVHLMNEPNTAYIDKRRKIKNTTSENTIPMYVGNTRAGIIEVYSDDPEMQKPVGHLPASVFPGCNHAERIYGDSMYPLICNQAYVIGKVIDKKGIIWGEKYIIHTKYGQSMVKYVHPSDQGPAFIKIVSHNKTVPPQDINLDDVTFVCRVHFIVNPS